MTPPEKTRTRELYAWALFDWATSPFAAIVVTFVVATYVAKAVAPTEVEGQAAWGLGYAGGLACLVLALVLFLQPDVPSFGLDKESMAHVRIVGPLVALWLVAFSLPLFLVVRDRPGRALPDRGVVKTSLRNLRTTLREVVRDRRLALFLVAAMLWADGLATLFAVGGIYAGGTFGMSVAEVLRFGIVLNVTAGIGAWAFARFDDRVGAKPTIVIGLVGLIGCGSGALLAPSQLVFEIAGAALGLFVGPVQSATRSTMARLAPPERRAEMFGVLALTGRATSFLGPMLVAIMTTLSGSQRIGMVPILLLWTGGLVLLAFLPLSGGSGARRS
jgi:UMF1 family MFS transporter